MRTKSKGTGLMATGLLLLAAALILSAYNLWNEYQASVIAQRILEQMLVQESADTAAGLDEVEIPDYILNPEMEMPTEEIDGNEYIGILDIPALDLSLPVISEWSYPGLKVSPCRYSGSAYLDNMVIAGHSYKRHFGVLSSLPAGTEVIFTDIDGNVFYYEVAATEVLKPTATEEMTDSDWDLTLFTCTFDSRSRFALRCERMIYQE